MRSLLRNPLFRWLRNFVSGPDDSGIDLSRRAALGAGLTGLGAGVLFAVHPLAGSRTFNPALIRPPGSVTEDEFLARCIRCGECMKICPTNAIQPTLFEAGLEGLWSPVLKMNLGYCEFECNLCTQVCPTDAIRLLDPEDKKQVRIGTAFFDRNRCLPYASARPCIVCEEHCPTPTKAIWFEEAEVVNEKGEAIVVKQPHVNAELCTGCGICQNKCVIRDVPGVYVTSAGETRNPENQILLTGGGLYG
jgi:ferredoxin-type protein NapF